MTRAHLLLMGTLVYSINDTQVNAPENKAFVPMRRILNLKFAYAHVKLINILFFWSPNIPNNFLSQLA